jgi:hypothetical protein
VSVKLKKRKNVIDFFLLEKCASDGTYISLMNHSTSKDIDISRWTLKRHVDSKTKVRFTIPDGVRLHRDSELRLYANQDGVTSSSHDSGGSLSPGHEIVNNDLTSWGM